MRRLKRWIFALLGKDPEAVVVSFWSGEDSLVLKMIEEIRTLVPDRRHYVVKLEPGRDRPAVMDSLRADGIGTAEYVPCIHLQPYMRERFGFDEGLCPVAEEIASRTLALPFFSQIEAEDQARVVEALAAAPG